MGNAPDAERPALIAGRYEVRQELARGGMGVVYAVHDRATNASVALKRLLGSSSSNKAISNLFQREYHTLVQLQHPRIIEVYDYGVDGDGAYYTMELLDGKDLRDIAPLEYRQACRHLRDVASSLALLHARRLIHRDLSARNVRLTSEGRAKLFDFGALATFGISGQVVGTPPVVPPEAMSGQALDQRSDLYALGALAYGLLTARYAYPAQSLPMLPALWQQGPPPPPSRFAKDIPQELDQLVLSLLSLDMVSRPSSAAEVIERLNVIAGLESEEVLEVGQSYLANPEIVGRSRELERLRRAVGLIVGGGSVSLVIEGEAGVGKTRLMQETAVEAQLRGVSVLRVDAEIQRGPYGVARGLAAALFVGLRDVALRTVERHASVLSPVLPEVHENFPGIELDGQTIDRNEQRIRVQVALDEWFSAVAAERPLLVLIDSAHVADEASLAFCASIARRYAKKAIGIVATVRTGDGVLAGRTLERFRAASDVISIGGLTPSETIELVAALFGEVDNAGRLGQWLRDLTDGNPMQCLSLAAQMIVEKHITYRDGAWVLPAELSREKWASGMTQVLERRVAQLSDGARALVEAISIERGKLSIEQCRALSGADGDEIFPRLDELVQKDMLVGFGDGYRFGQVALQRCLRDHLSEQRKKELHRRAGEYLLGTPDADDFVRIEAGRHLLHAEESRGADILALVGSRLVRTIEGTALAAPALELAFKVYEEEGRSKWAMLGVLEALTSAGWYVDRRYAVKYGERALELAMELSGLRLATKWAPFVGAKLALGIGTVAAGFRHAFAKSKIEVESLREFRGVFESLIAALAIMIGVAATCVDPKSGRRLMDGARILRAFPSDHIMSVIYDYCSSVTLGVEGYPLKARPFGVRALEWFESGKGTAALGAPAARALSGGQMTNLALYSALTGEKDAVHWAERLENLGLSFYVVMGAQARFVYHVLRGEMSMAAPYRERLELNAVHGGTTWQTSIFIPLYLGLTYTATGDVVRLRQCAEELERMVDEIPTLAVLSSVYRAAYHFWRGRPAQALSLLEALGGTRQDEAEPYGRNGAGLYARALMASGRTTEALSFCRTALEALPAEERGHGLLGSDIILALAVAEAESGETTAAKRRLDDLLEKQKEQENPLVLALVYEAHARVADKAGAPERAQEHAVLMGKWARVSENTALVTRWKALESEVGKRSVEHKTATTNFAFGGITHALSAIRTVLEQHAGLDRARAALRLILENTNTPRGYLYLGTPPDLRLAVQVPEDAAAPPQNVTEYILDLASAVHQSTNFVERTDDVTRTSGLSALQDDGESPLQNEMTARLLIITRAGQPRVVGAVALRRDSEGPSDLSYEMLEAIAHCLAEVAPAQSATSNVRA